MTSECEFSHMNLGHYGAVSTTCKTHGITWPGGDETCPVQVAKVEGVRLGLEAGGKSWLERENELRLAGLSGFADELWRTRTQRINALDPEAIAKEADRG